MKNEFVICDSQTAECDKSGCAHAGKHLPIWTPGSGKDKKCNGFASTCYEHGEGRFCLCISTDAPMFKCEKADECDQECGHAVPHLDYGDGRCSCAKERNCYVFLADDEPVKIICNVINQEEEAIENE